MISDSFSNPNPGVIINQPNGSNVYEGVRVDYRGNDVTPENFLAILQGDMKSVRGGSGRVIASSASDHIFVYFVDHGATGLIQFPNSILTVKQLNDALRLMHAKHQYKRVVFFMEACEGGSMFNNILPKNINVYAVTSANEKESAWACYCDNDREGLPCLGDVFSVSWMGNADSVSAFRDLKSEKLKTQVEIAREATTSSHVMEYGNMSIGNLSAANFEGSKPVFADSLQPKKVVQPGAIALTIFFSNLLSSKRVYKSEVNNNSFDEKKCVNKWSVMYSRKRICSTNEYLIAIL
ncbi:unnamed protein product [Anisakis simplex]|uniref:Legumain (inferred by orthology to a human protein) n=1 Tax=Anisakis simplex TaxID=6269 RepID=A0A0M3J3X0_ANISI|nr:unnamed protein product [Anisakis simplex]